MAEVEWREREGPSQGRDLAGTQTREACSRGSVQKRPFRKARLRQTQISTALGPPQPPRLVGQMAVSHLLLEKPGSHRRPEIGP